MKKILLSVFILSMLFFGGFNAVDAKILKINGYYKPSIGKYVQPYYKTSPNKTKIDNYSTKGNYNPFNGKIGTINPYKF